VAEGSNTMTVNDSSNEFSEKDYPDSLVDYYESSPDDTLTIWISECCYAYPLGELDMSSVPYGGPSGFCSRCHDNCIFIKEDEAE